MTPGQDVNKDVSAVNTGSIDAFVRLALENQLTITVPSKSDLTFSIGNTYKSVTYYKINQTTVTTEATTYTTETDANTAKGTLQAVAAEGTTYAVRSATVEGTTTYYIDKTVVVTLPDRYKTEAERNTQKNALQNLAGTGVTYGDGTETVNTVLETTKTAPDATVLGTGVKLSTGQSLNENTGKLTANEVTTLQAGGTLVLAASEIVPASEQFVVSGDDTTPPSQSDYDGSGQYTPSTAGLYVFKRTLYDDDATKTEYSGYYYDGTDFYALKTKTTTTATGSKTTPYIDFGIKEDTTPNKGFTLNDAGEITAIEGTISLLTHTTYKTAGMDGSGANLATITPEFGLLTSVSNVDTWTKVIDQTAVAALNDTSNVNAIKLVVTLGENGTTTNNTVIYIKLASDWTTNWYLKPDASTGSVADWFYYKDTVKSGETTEKLVDYVRLANTVSTNDFVELTYDLNAVLNSVQVSYNNEGDETAAAVDTTTWATPALTTNPVENNGSVSKITAVSWS